MFMLFFIDVFLMMVPYIVCKLVQVLYDYNKIMIFPFLVQEIWILFSDIWYLMT